MSWLPALVFSAWVPVSLEAQPQHPPSYSPEALRAADAIRAESVLPPQGPAGRPLPLASHWNMGSQGEGWTPQYQVKLLDAGHRILPWMSWPTGDPDKDDKARARFDEYYADLLRYCRDLNLPISFRGTQWEAMLVDETHQDLPDSQFAGVLRPDGKHVRKLSPFGPVAAWKEPAAVYVDTPAMKRVQELYPDPPLVLFVSNNEAPDLRWHQVETMSKRYLEKYGVGQSDEFKRKVVGEGWRERYPVLFDAMRAALVSPAWRENVRFVGYGAFGPSHFGRWSEWLTYSLTTEEWTSPYWHFWEGGSPSYYTHNWSGIRDHLVWSTQVESMNWIFQLDEAWSVNPDFWWEVSLWDGNSGQWTPDQGLVEEMLPKSKACQYMADGQTYTPDRYEGWAQFGLWLLRPRVMREFRGSTTPLDPWLPYFERLLEVVDAVHDNPTLERFWRHGQLVANPAHEHPYQEKIPERSRTAQRWYLLDTSLDPPRPWTQETNLPVFALAYALGEGKAREWLLYAHAPLGPREEIRITLPGHMTITIDVSQAGSFVHIDAQGIEVIL